MRVLFINPPQTKAIKWDNYKESNWEWPEINKDEIRDTIFSSSTKSIIRPDGISYLILQKAFNIIESRFVILYSKLIQYGYHPICWREATRVILKKPNRDASSPKSYRVISLLNCLGKISEKIIARRLAYLVNTSNIVHFDQMGSRKQISAIDVVMSLVHDIQLAKHDNEDTSVLFINPPQIEAIKWDNYKESNWEWPEVNKDEIKDTIFSSSIKSIAGPDGISYLILQKAFNIIENRFVILYSKLIQYGYHSIY